MLTVLSEAEMKKLHDCEQVLERGKTVWIEMGRALEEIRVERLYRQRYATFEEYCQRRWNFTASRARQLIDAVRVAVAINKSTAGYELDPAEKKLLPRVTLPTEKHARALAPVLALHGAEQAAQVYERLQKKVEAENAERGGEVSPTAIAVRNAAKEYMEQEQAKKPAAIVHEPSMEDWQRQKEKANRDRTRALIAEFEAKILALLNGVHRAERYQCRDIALAGLNRIASAVRRMEMPSAKGKTVKEQIYLRAYYASLEDDKE